MECFICERYTKEYLMINKITLGYCEEHSSIVQKGAIKFKSSSNKEYLLKQKCIYLSKEYEPSEREIQID